MRRHVSMEKVRKSGVLLNGLPFPLFGANTILQRKVQKIARFSSFPWKGFFLGERFFHERYTNVILGSQEEFHSLIRLEVHFSKTRKEFNLAANLSGLESALTGQDSRTILLHDLLCC